MRKLFFTVLALVPITLWAQGNVWEPDGGKQAQRDGRKPKVEAKYLRGAVPEVNGQVVFSQHLDAPGKSAAQVYDILSQSLEQLTQTSEQIDSKIVTTDAQKHEIVGAYQEWLVFKSTSLMLDRTRFFYALSVKCADGGADIEMTRIRYLYEEEREPQRMTAEEWITDKESVNKKNTKLLPISGKFRRKTIDRKDFLFNKLQSLLK